MNQLTILTIDDEENIRNGLADNFELEGYNVLQASNGKEGLAIIAKGGVDLVITDLRMDGISGEEVVQHVTTENPGIPIIVLTGHGSIEEANNGVNVYIGDESKIDSDVTVIKTRYKANGEEGTIAIIGPKRMEYERVVNCLNFIKENIEGE